MSDLQGIAVVRFAAVSLNTGLMWTVAAICYPLFAHVPKAAFVAYHAAHCARIQWLVAPFFGVEIAAAGASVWAFFGPLDFVSAGLTFLGLLATAVVAVPHHNQLGQGFDPRVLKNLARMHFLRCGLWTLNLGLLGVDLAARSGRF